jgi:hypothetical protein
MSRYVNEVRLAQDEGMVPEPKPERIRDDSFLSPPMSFKIDWRAAELS